MNSLSIGLMTTEYEFAFKGTRHKAHRGDLYTITNIEPDNNDHHRNHNTQV
jgi:hypothetical protein